MKLDLEQPSVQSLPKSNLGMILLEHEDNPTLLALGINSECENMGANAPVLRAKFTTRGDPTGEQEGVPEEVMPQKINYRRLSHRIQAERYLQSHHTRQVIKTLEANI